MGKGKGSFLRWIIRIKRGQKILELKNFSYYRVNFLKKILQKKTSLKLSSFFLKKNFNKVQQLSFNPSFNWFQF
jgi:ribosomal protein L16/L10AE